LKFLGKGAFGKVYAARKRNTTDLYALKMIDIDEDWGI
jgi:serine/threonine protein kinase